MKKHFVIALGHFAFSTFIFMFGIIVANRLSAVCARIQTLRRTNDLRPGLFVLAVGISSRKEELYGL